MPDNPRTAIPIDQNIRRKLCAERIRTGVGPMHLLRGAKDKPVGLTASVVGLWLSGKVVSAVPQHITYMLARWCALPDNRRLALTPEMRAELAAEFERTGLGPVQILKKAADMPAGLTRQMVQSWTSDKPKPGTVGEAYWIAVMARLRSLPDGEPITARSNKVARSRQVEINAHELIELRHHRERTGIGGTILLRGAAEKPIRLTPAMISGWLSGEVKRADPHLVVYVLARYRAWP